MKSGYYLATVINAYRRAMDGQDLTQSKIELNNVGLASQKFAGIINSKKPMRNGSLKFKIGQKAENTSSPLSVYKREPAAVKIVLARYEVGLSSSFL